VVSYATLVDLALASHNPRWQAHKVQYASLILAHNDEQLSVAIDRAARVSTRLGGPLATRIEPLKRFWTAEDYHQKYYLRNDRALASDFQRMFDGDETAFRESTAAARVNGYAAGDGARAQLAREIDFLGLGQRGRERLISRVRDVANGGSCSVL
jgi:peptide-methionine (S)-S-oxide reductase